MMSVKCWMVFVSERLCENLHMLLGAHSVCIVILMKTVRIFFTYSLKNTFINYCHERMLCWRDCSERIMYIFVFRYMYIFIF